MLFWPWMSLNAKFCRAKRKSSKKLNLHCHPAHTASICNPLFDLFFVTRNLPDRTKYLDGVIAVKILSF